MNYYMYIYLHKEVYILTGMNIYIHISITYTAWNGILIRYYKCSTAAKRSGPYRIYVRGYEVLIYI